MQIIELGTKEHSDKRNAKLLTMSFKTVHTHLNNGYLKMDVHFDFDDAQCCGRLLFEALMAEALLKSMLVALVMSCLTLSANQETMELDVQELIINSYHGYQYYR